MDAILHGYKQFCWTVGQALIFLGPLHDVIWPVLGLLPLVLIAMAVGAFDAKLQTEKVSQTLRLILISQPVLWVVACLIFIPFWDDMGPDRPIVEAVIGWVNLALIALLVLPGLAAVAVSKGWNRAVAAFFGLVNLWFLLVCCFIGLMAVSGTWI
jgi:hypothetical protein